MTHPRYAIGQNKKLGTKAKLESSQQADEFILGRVAYGSLRINNAEKACCGPATAAATTRATETRNKKQRYKNGGFTHLHLLPSEGTGRLIN